MPAVWPNRVHTALLLSEAVPRRIAMAGPSSMHVQSIYRSVVNISTADGLLTIAAAEAGALPNGILADLGADWRMLGIQAGMVAHARPTHLRVPDAGLEIRLDAALRWSPRLRLPDEVAGPATARWRRRGRATWAIAQRRASAGGFGPLFRHAATHDERAGMLDVARPIMAKLIAALEAGDGSAAAQVAVNLIGLGPGLTPSGDDALVGIEAALHALGSPAAGFLAPAVDDVEDRTTALAATLLRHAAAGEFAERLHTLVRALLGSDDEAVAMAIERAAAWGATSGTDCLLGVLIGLDVAAGVREALP